jgi:hypothetical protein
MFNNLKTEDTIKKASLTVAQSCQGNVNVLSRWQRARQATSVSADLFLVASATKRCKIAAISSGTPVCPHVKTLQPLDEL